ncbi:MAG: hypothetical protein WC650_01885 [Candidatus Doudnabacteria bacterium]
MKENKNPHDKVESNYEYPKGYNGAKEPEEQATILREEYQFLLKPLANINKLPEGAEGFWVIPPIQNIVPSNCEHPYNYAVDFVLERIGKSREFRNWRQGKTGHLYLRQSKRTLSLWNQLTLIQGEKFTPVVPAQFGKKHRGESVDCARENVLDNEILFGAYPIGVMLLTHPEREQVWEQLHVDCGGDEYAPDGDGEFVSASLFDWYDGELHFNTRWTYLANRPYGSASGFVPQG